MSIIMDSIFTPNISKEKMLEILHKEYESSYLREVSTFSEALIAKMSVLKTMAETYHNTEAGMMYSSVAEKLEQLINEDKVL